MTMHEDRRPRVLVITGPVGSGKSTVMEAITDVLGERDVPNVGIDMDYLRWVHPHPPGDAFAAQLGNRNLAAIWPNLRAIEPRFVVVADVVESRDQTQAYLDAMPGTDVTIVRLDVPMETILRRLAWRESDGTIEWYRNRAPELQEIMEREQVADIVINVGGRGPEEVAREILERTNEP